MIRRLKRHSGFPIWLGELPGVNVPFDLFGLSGAAVYYNYSLRMLCMPFEGGNLPVPIEELRSPYSVVHDFVPEGCLNFETEALRAKHKAVSFAFEPAMWHAFVGEERLRYADRLVDLRAPFKLGAENLVYELGDVSYAIDDFGQAVVYSAGGFIPAVSDTIAAVQVASSCAEFDDGIKHVNLFFAGTPPNRVILPDSCVSCYVPSGLRVNLSIGSDLASRWAYWSAVWQKPYVVYDGFSSTPDGLVVVRK